MDAHGIAGRWKRAARVAVALAVACSVSAAGRAAQDARAVDAAAQATIAAALDGRSFRGEIRDEKGVVRAQDVLSFRDGTFRSAKCKEMGFDDSRYWMRIEGDVVHFLVESENPAAGRIRLSGRVRGAHAEWAGMWSKERWYWTLRRDISFQGIEIK